MRVRFIKCPTGMYNLSYGPGDEAILPEPQARELIADGYAVAVQVIETTVSKVKSQKAVIR